MHSDHDAFLSAIRTRELVRIVFVAKSDGARRERTCAPLDFGPSRRAKTPTPKYHVHDLDSPSGRHALSLDAEQIVSIVPTGETFDPADIVTWDTRSSPWHIERDWGAQS